VIKNKNSWYAEGLYFERMCCGSCCARLDPDVKEGD